VQPNEGETAVSARSYLSIGDVLTLLRQEFPDVTISKIRFLESQGLVNPERTPSGYRKFYEHDVERLRWVLRQQREHFLPLKVIKDRLDDDANSVDTAAEPARTRTPAPAAEAEATPPAEPVLVGQRSSSAGGAAEPVAASAATAPTGPVGSAAPTRREPATPTAAPPVERAHRANLAQPPRVADAVPAANGTGNGSTGHSKPSSRASSPSSDTPASRPSRPSSPAAPSPSAAGDDGGSASVAAASGGASLSLAELTAACGLSEEYVGQLQEYGLIRATSVGGAPYFDEEALTVANVAARFAEFGIEARHLRLYKNAADREAGFIEQVVIPMVRQRNPEARARATQTADDLARLGQQLKGSLLRSGLRDLLNG
jgi:DNA-binding transcriptional MerR regulator